MQEEEQKVCASEEVEEQDAIGNALTYWFGTEYWHKSEPRNPTCT